MISVSDSLAGLSYMWFLGLQMKKTSYTLHGMDKYVEYVIRVEAEGANGAGLSSEPITVRTLSDLPSMPPTDVRYEF